NSTTVNNTCTEAGGGFFNQGTLSIRSCTITGNVAPLGGGIFQGRGMTELQGTLVAQNQGGNAPDVRGSFVSRGHNLIGARRASAPTRTASRPPRAPGATPPPPSPPRPPRRPPPAARPPPRPVSPATPACAAAAAGNLPATDQRGFPRPQDGNGDGVAVAD